MRAALVTDVRGAIVQAAGLIHYRCITYPNAAHEATPQTEEGSRACEYTPTLTIFYENAETKNAAVTEQIIEWAKANVAARINTMKISSKEKKLVVEVKFVHGA